jgi:hypothetical protein
VKVIYMLASYTLHIVIIIQWHTCVNLYSIKLCCCAVLMLTSECQQTGVLCSIQCCPAIDSVVPVLLTCSLHRLLSADSAYFSYVTLCNVLRACLSNDYRDIAI